MRKRISIVLALLLLLSMTACGQTAPEQTEPQTTVAPETTAAPEITAAPAPVIDNPQTLKEALESQMYVVLEGSMELEASAVFQGAELDGGGYTLTAPAYVEENAETHNGLTVRRGLVKDLKIQGGYRAIGDSRNHPLTGDVRLVNVWAEGQTNAINFGYGKTEGTLNAEGCTFYGWSSYKGFNSAYFENCTFGKGGSEAKGNLRPYINTTLIDCHFESRTTASGTVQPYAILLRDSISGITITMENCYADGVLITQENVEQLLEIKTYDNTLRICNTVE